MKKWLIAALAATALIGCADNTAGLRVDGETHKVLFGDNVLAGNLKIEDIATTEVEGHARGVVRMTNQSKGDLNVLYRFYWYDENGLEVNTKLSPWRQSILRGTETVALSEVSVNPNGKHFRLQIRENNQ